MRQNKEFGAIGVTNKTVTVPIFTSKKTKSCAFNFTPLALGRSDQRKSNGAKAACKILVKFTPVFQKPYVSINKS